MKSSLTDRNGCRWPHRQTLKSTTAVYRKLLLKSLGPFWLVSATDDTFVINEDGVENGMSIDSVNRESRTPLSSMLTAQTTTTPDVDADGSHGNETVPPLASAPDKLSQTAVIDCLVEHENRPVGT